MRRQGYRGEETFSEAYSLKKKVKRCYAQKRVEQKHCLQESSNRKKKKQQQQTRHVHGPPLKGNQAEKPQPEHLF